METLCFQKGFSETRGSTLDLVRFEGGVLMITGRGRKLPVLCLNFFLEFVTPRSEKNFFFPQLPVPSGFPDRNPTLKKGHRLFHRLSHAPGQRDDHQQPNQNSFHRLHVLGFRFHVVFLRHRPHQQIRHQAHHEQSHHQMENRIVRLLRRHRFLVRHREPIHQLRPDHRRHRPRRDQPPVDRPDLVTPKQIPQIRRNRRKPTPIHRQNQPRRHHEQRHISLPLRPRYTRIQRRPQNEVNAVNPLAPRQIRHRRPKKPPSQVAQRQQPHIPRRRRRRHLEHVLNHRRRLPQNPNPRAHIHAQHHPQ